jgi:pyrroline-5-carboxylate reductase
MSRRVIEEIKDSLSEKQIVISVAAGVSLADLNTWLNAGTKVVRIMPNIPISVTEGLTMICETDVITKDELEYIIKVLSSFGKVEVMDEKYINAFVALASSSPGIVFVMIQAMADAAVAMGLSRKRSYKIVSQAVLGSAKMVVETGKHPGELKDMVCSPAGTTIDAIASLEESGFRYSIIKALKVGEEKCSRISK